MNASDTRPVLEGDRDFSDFFRGLEAKENTVRIFDRNAFFSIHGADAISAANELYKTQSVVKELASLPSLTMTRIVCERYVRQALFVQGLRIEIWEGGRSKWHISKSASPGNVQAIETFLVGGNTDSASLLSLQLSRTKDGLNLGVCYSDPDRRLIGLAEFFDTEAFCHLESLIIQLGIKECLLPDSATENVLCQKIKNVLQRCNVVLTTLKPQDFTSKSIISDFARLLSEKERGIDWETKPLGLTAASALTKYLNLLSDPSQFGQYDYWQFNSTDYMRLDGSALKALSLVPSAHDGANKSMNLFGLLNRCRTVIGSRLLSQWLKQPLLSLEEIEKRHNLVSLFILQNEIRDTLQSELKLMPDLSRLSNKFRKGQAHLEDVVRAYQVTTRLPEIIAGFELQELETSDADVIQTAYIDSLSEIQHLLGKFQDLVETTVDLNALDRHEYLIRADFDDNLGQLRSKIEEIRSSIDAEHRLVADQLGVEIEKKLKLENHSSFGFCLRLSRTEASIIRNKSGYKELRELDRQTQQNLTN